MSVKRKQKLIVDLYKEAMEYTPFELNETLSNKFNVAIDNIESKSSSKEDEEVNSFTNLIDAIDTCLPYFKTQLLCINSNSNRIYSMKEVEDKLIYDYMNDENDEIAELNVNDWCVKNGIFNISSSSSSEKENQCNKN